MKRLAITTGGTGGHIFPALAVAQALRVMHPGLEVAFVGGHGPEAVLARKAGLRFVSLPAKGVFGRGLRGFAEGVLSTRAIIMAMGFYRTFRPDLVAGFGGYASFFPVVAARLLGIPTALHEQNSVPGVTNKLLGKIVSRVFVTYPDEAGVFPAGKTVHTGNPVRHDIAAMWQAPAKDDAGSRNVLVLGGSQGAQAINTAVLAALPRLLDSGIKVTIQTGRADFERVAEAAGETSEARRAAGRAEPGELAIENFIEDMAAAYAWADLIIARSGASTLAEITSAKKPAILIPFPFATHDHQTVNASFMAKAGAAVVIDQKRLDPASLADLVLNLFDHPERLSAMALAAGKLAAPRAAETIAHELSALAASRTCTGGRS
ncbi:undecaprenyldiphospho-muramoylpentapeptide beta-N-acetylglucosaminyltransferase [Desulfovibrio sulfodismutans]|uniref:UDP-N-acetylglucosamine--N-acetylmuramyl-(pentapeptide) pyrophosphoryl-undecaprenol N-acetylglucosamine transferase n=1 Tax=Desulfolutivibrio sulfodismutans TaxID=63561 RepID=A0A7K3NIN7_9BACT|nr:undecaprenyldiphospho-muramoylpentapeptide beta-N-acetylglucosaminyltransferase [Desulfolutivibrio sulfodismutans]NDY56048.1 undecaprenyldiphospho-muramoylpentapeptide beta-N-acetylglucosaminyltransferase [Desulfolutivibrio sulfodismutans]QLA12305.1 undecaprenyldiphospho-muramoylpentapeptide beta-N-acetylglucosaminyltransferase [Desulfolutivibrio sulfodismutans DSM 3696]